MHLSSAGDRAAGRMLLIRSSSQNGWAIQRLFLVKLCLHLFSFSVSLTHSLSIWRPFYLFLEMLIFIDNLIMLAIDFLGHVLPKHSVQGPGSSEWNSQYPFFLEGQPLVRVLLHCRIFSSSPEHEILCRYTSANEFVRKCGTRLLGLSRQYQFGAGNPS